jgi:putative DNA methylase
MTPIKSPKKLIEVALPLDAINVACAREKSIRHGHPSTLHLWWARRPLAAARAVIFAQMVNDPGYQQGGGFKYGVNKEEAAIKRERLFKIIEDLVLWENTNNEVVLQAARDEIWKSWRETCELNRKHPQASELFNPDKLPAFHDPFAGGGALPLEAQRLDLESYASDLNPVAVTINKAMIEIPPKFAGRAPVGPRLSADRQEDHAKDWTGAKGLAEDVRRYGAWMRAEAQKRIGHLYPQITVTSELIASNAISTRAIGQSDIDNMHNSGLAGLQVGQKLTVIAWLWARTVKSPNPAYSHVDVPLASSFVLSSKEGKEAYVHPVVDGQSYSFEMRTGTPPESAKGGTTAGKRAAFICLFSGSPIDYNHIRAEGKAGRMGQRLMAIVAEGARGRIYLSPTADQVVTAESAKPEWAPEMELPNNPRDFKTPNYGLTKFRDLFTPRQLVALTTFSDLVPEAIARVRADAVAGGMAEDDSSLDSGGCGATAYSEAVGVYLAMAIDKIADYSSSLVAWSPTRDQAKTTFGRQALPMIWDFAEINPMAGAAGDFAISIAGICRAFPSLGSRRAGFSQHADAQTQSISSFKVISTDPPYYDNIGYADLSDFFYVWLRKSLRPIFPTLYATVAVPKADELVATPYRHGNKDKAEGFFLGGMTLAMHNLSEQAHPAFPVTIYYAFKQSDTKEDGGTHSTGWETFLEAVLRAGFSLTGTWPMRTERDTRTIGIGSNALASSIVLVCRKRSADAPTISRREFIRELNAALPDALLDMTRGGVNSPVAPVDLSQAIIGPGMAIFSQYSAVLEADGKPMSVRTALQLINRFFAEDDFDHDTQFCLAWFEQQGWATGKFGEADVLARAKGTSVGGLVESGVVASSAGSLQLIRWADLAKGWNPDTDNRTPIWEALHQLIRALNQDGESAAGSLLARMPARAEPIRALAYRLYTLCERKGWAEEARAYNELVTAWTGIEQASAESGVVGSQTTLDM